MPFFSVIIPTHNRAGWITTAIDSVLDQTFTDFELIVVDDGSTDETPAILDSYGASIIRLTQSRGGVSAARNAGIRIARGAHLAFLDSDDRWHADKLDRQADFIRANPGVRIHQSEELWIRNGVRVNPMKKHSKVAGAIFLVSLERCMISPSAVVLERGLFDSVGLFDEALPVCEDYDLWLRITCREQVGLLPRPLITKQGGHADQLSRSVWAMDRFRVYAICKLLQNDSAGLPPEYLRAARQTAIAKCSLLATGAEKRGHDGFARQMGRLREQIIAGSCSNTDFDFLVKE